MHGHGHVTGQGPRRGRPDDHIGAGGIGGRENVLQLFVVQGEAHVDGRRLVIGVFHFRLGQRCLAGTAPVDGLLAADDVALFHKVGQLGGGGGLVFGIHRLIGMLPVTEGTEALEFLALDVDELVRVLAAAAAYRVGRQILFLVPQLVLYLELDGQAVAVPAGHVDGTLALHVAGLDDDVLQNLVQGMAKVQMAVGVGRAVVQAEGTPASRGVQHGGVRIVFFPPAQHFRLALGEIGFHGKGGRREIQGFLIVAHEQAPSISTPECNRKLLLQARALVKAQRTRRAPRFVKRYSLFYVTIAEKRARC